MWMKTAKKILRKDQRSRTTCTAAISGLRQSVAVSAGIGSTKVD
jgi:hypothetical protein